MLYCQSMPAAHRAPAAYALTFARACGHEAPARILACHEHGEQLRSRPRAEEETPCELCAEDGLLTLVRIEEVFEERVMIAMRREVVDRSALPRITLAYDRACRAVMNRGLQPVSGYRVPVQWRSTPQGYPPDADMMEADVMLAVTRPMPV
jgi:hypothetical protein